MTPASQEFESYVVFLRNASEYEDQSLSFDEYFESTEERQMAARVKAPRGKPQDQRLFRHFRPTGEEEEPRTRLPGYLSTTHIED